MQELREKLAKAANADKDLLDDNERLRNHVKDLESRKRAPLYQKKQEEELKAASEKAQEAEARAQEAEIKFKEAKVDRAFSNNGLYSFLILGVLHVSYLYPILRSFSIGGTDNHK